MQVKQPSRRRSRAPILGRRAKGNAIDFVNGVATAITPMAFHETVMVKGYENLVDSGTRVDVSTGMVAAGRLRSLTKSRASGNHHRRPHGADTLLLPRRG